MAKVQGVKEKLHSPLYDAFFVKDEVKDRRSQKNVHRLYDRPTGDSLLCGYPEQDQAGNESSSFRRPTQPEYVRGAGIARGGVQPAPHGA